MYWKGSRMRSLNGLAGNDAEEYKKKLLTERRDDYAFQNREARLMRMKAAVQARRAREDEHESFELNRAAAKDVEEYQKQEEQKKRESLAFRNNEKFRHAQIMEEIRSLAHQEQTESLVLKWAGQDDGKAYLARLKEERRKSLEKRGREAKRIREYEQHLRDHELNSRQEDEELKRACKYPIMFQLYFICVCSTVSHHSVCSIGQKDVEAYKKECAERNRASLCLRQKEAHIQKLEEETRLQRKRQTEEENFELESMARTDVEEYVEECKRRRRLSLVSRAKEQRRHHKWKKNREEQERKEISRQANYRAIDTRYAELARQEERTNIALDAIRHAGCTFSNPFSGLFNGS